MFRESAEKYARLPAFATRDANKRFVPVTFEELYENGLNLATALIQHGLKAREHVGLISDNRYEWILADYGVILSGAADVPRGTDVNDAELTYILNHSQASFVFVENKRILDRIKKLQGELNRIKHIILMERESKAPAGIFHIYDLIEEGRELRRRGDRRAEKRIDAVKPDDLFTLIYTSGTTGVPKGVMLMHSNMIAQVRNCPIAVGPEDRVLSILPVWHIFERVFEMITVGAGTCTSYTNIRNIRDDMKIVRPTFMASAPRLWESVYNGILKNIKAAPPIKQRLFNIAYFFSRRFKGGLRFLTGNELDLVGRNPAVSAIRAIWSLINVLLFALPNLLFDAIVLKKIRAATGGEIKGSVSGGGALPEHIDLFFNNIGIPVLEGYGLTETCPVLSVRLFDKIVIGTIGPLWPETELRIVDTHSGEILYPPRRGGVGEIHVRGPQVMKGYYRDLKGTQNVLRDGWLNTGDLGMLTYNDCLKITGRSKDTIVLLGGENAEPLPIENRILESEMIDQCMLVGQDRKYLGALIVPSEEYFKNYGSIDKIAANEEVRKIILDNIKGRISEEHGYRPHERIINIALLPKAFTVGDELTAKLSIKRHVIAEKYKKKIEEIYR